MKKISVIIPTLNSSKTIKKTLNSLKFQNYKNFEIIILDSFSLDGTINIINSYKFKNIKIFRISKQKTLAQIRYFGILKSTGSYIAFLDCDDIWHKNKLTKQLDFMKKKKILFSFTSYKIINEEGKILSARNAAPVIQHHELLKSCDVSLSSVMLSKSLINKKCQFASLKTKEDYVLWLKITKYKTNLYGLNEFLLFWRKTKNSLSSNTKQKLIDGFRVYNQYMGFNFIKSFYYLILLSINYIKKNIND